MTFEGGRGAATLLLYRLRRMDGTISTLNAENFRGLKAFVVTIQSIFFSCTFVLEIILIVRETTKLAIVQIP